MSKNYFVKLSATFICLLCWKSIWALSPTDSLGRRPDDFVIPSNPSVVQPGILNSYLKSLRVKSVVQNSTANLKPPKQGILAQELVVSGKVRFSPIFRSMENAYSDMRTSKQNLSFVDYPSGGNAIAQGAYPLLELNLASKLTKNVDFNIGYSYSYGFSGNDSTVNNKSLSSIQNLRFGANLKTAIGTFSFSAGQILPLKLSKFTMSQPIYRDNYFDRLPWDWFRNSFLRYDEYYTLKSNMGGQNQSRALFSGCAITGNILPLGVNVTALFGRTSLTSPYNSYLLGSPSVLYGARVEKNVFTRHMNGSVGLNGYFRNGFVSTTDNRLDINEIYSIDGDVKFKGFKLVGELAANKMNNPYAKEGGTAFQFRAEFDKKLLPIPISAEYYRIDHAFANYDGSVLNTNSNLRAGGSTIGTIDDPTYFLNLLQEVGQYTNNRQGVVLKTNLRVKKLTIDLGYATSQELQNLNDSIVTIQHRVNAFTRSRFNQWRMQTGPYGRVRSVFRRTFENIALTSKSIFEKRYTSAEAMLMYKTKLFKKDLIVMNYHTFGTVRSGISVFPSAQNSEVHVRQYYSETNIAYHIAKKLTGVLNYGFETCQGGDNTIRGENGKPLDQRGNSYGIGLDYDFMATGGLHLRHKWFDHKDINFEQDKFNGQETHLELVIFF
jgi:hypothetical protein